MDILSITDLFMSYVDDFIFEQIVVKKYIVKKIIKRSSEYRKKRRHAIKDNLGKSSEELLKLDPKLYRAIIAKKEQNNRFRNICSNLI